MAEMTIQLRINPETGKKDIVVSLSGESDSLPHEHERQHKQLVEKLIEGGILKASELGNVVVEREEETVIPQELDSTTPQDQRKSQSEGS